MLVVQAACVAEGLEAGVGVLGDVAPDIVVDALGDAAVSGVDDQTGAAEVVADDAVGCAVFGQVVRHVGFAGVDEAADGPVVAVQFGDGVELVLVEETLHQHAVDGFADAAVLPVGKVINGGGVGQGDVFEVAQDIVGVLGGLPVFGLALQFAVGGVAV
uniref:hypothetical protein n=1 Tax=Methylovulum psychrotolerans TaxID=1704499 RepID=UPI0038CC0B83